ncbi:probable hydrolase PNKD isoform X1 [Lytechinus pictus]|uniref:probable hydrolase PNKD isoform X1 n=1 Tax=Lytechinus pictus TaxID=7653 RepID=UPI0030BA0583
MTMSVHVDFNFILKIFEGDDKSPIYSLNFLFICRYTVYAKTRVGNYLNRRDLTKNRLQFPDGHSLVEQTEINGVIILPIPYLKDNYAYLIIDKRSNVAVVIDPGDAEAVQKVIEEQNVQLTAILTTHKHWDHSGGNRKLKSSYSNLSVYGGERDGVPGATHKLKDGECIQFGDLKFTALFTPGHTVGHMVYLLDRSDKNIPSSLFTGDILFLGGNGRMFEGAPSIMLSSLDKICSLSDNILIWPGHEYALDNLQFAHNFDAENEDVTRKLHWVEERRKERKITSPSTLGEEKTYNPFLRTSEDSILQKVDPGHQTTSDRQALRVKALAFLRKSKDSFSYKL